MNQVAIKVERLSKQYQIGEINAYPMFREMLMKGVSAPFRNLRLMFSGTKKAPGADFIWALKDVCFTVNKGEAIGIIGSNGAGKSTLLKILSGITDPTAGYADLYGRIGSLLEVGTGFHMELTGRENIFMNGALLGMHRHEIIRKFDEIVAFSEIEKFLDTPVKRYSSGMYMRLAFAVAAHLEPEILAIDEVLAVGDAAFQKKCLGKMGRVAKDGRTILFVSHNMIAIKSLCRRAIWIDEGQIKEIGESSRVVSNYLHSNLSSQTVQIWNDIETAPGNDIIRLHRICVQGKNQSQPNLITMQTPFAIEVEFWNLKSDVRLNINLHLITEEGIVAFSTSSADESGWWTEPLPAGRFRGICHIPANLLNSGQHTVNLFVVKDLSRVIYRKDDVLTLDVLDLEERPEGWFGKGSGIVSPILDWTMENVDTLPQPK